MKHILSNGEISELISDSGEGGMSKEVHLLKHQNKKYVLRICKNEKIAKDYEKISKKFSKYNFLPKFLGRMKNKVLFEYIEGRDCKKSDALKVAEQIGKILGMINKTKIKKQINFEKRFSDSLKEVKNKKLINKETFGKCKLEYSKFKKIIKIKKGLDANDIIPNNFRVFKGKVYLVDIEMIAPNLISRGVAKSFLKWFKTPVQRKKFLKGYDSVNNSKFLTKEYLQFLFLYFLITNMETKIYNGLSNKGNIEKLNKFLKGNLK